MAQILIVLIHNQNSERLPSSRQVVRFLESVLKKGGHNVVLDEVWQQEEVKIQPRLKYITSFIYSAVTQVRYQALHLKQVPRRWLPYFFQALNIFKVLFLSSGDLRKWEIDKILTKKHLTAWRLGSNFDFTFVVEDDAILSPNNDGLGG